MIIELCFPWNRRAYSQMRAAIDLIDDALRLTRLNELTHDKTGYSALTKDTIWENKMCVTLMLRSNRFSSNRVRDIAFQVHGRSLFDKRHQVDRFIADVKRLFRRLDHVGTPTFGFNGDTGVLTVSFSVQVLALDDWYDETTAS